MEAERIGRKIRKFRETEEISIEEFAPRSGLNQDYIRTKQILEEEFSWLSGKDRALIRIINGGCFCLSVTPF